MVCLHVPRSIQSVPNNPHPVLNEEKCNEYLSGLLRKRSSESELLAGKIIVGGCTEKNTSHRKLPKGPQGNHKVQHCLCSYSKHLSYKARKVSILFPSSQI